MLIQGSYNYKDCHILVIVSRIFSDLLCLMLLFQSFVKVQKYRQQLSHNVIVHCHLAGFKLPPLILPFCNGFEVV